MMSEEEKDVGSAEEREQNPPAEPETKPEIEADDPKVQESPENPENPEKPDEPEEVAKKGKPGKKKKRAILFIGILLLLMVVLILLNTLDFDAIAEKIRGDSDDPGKPTVVTYPMEWFETPDYNEDITVDAKYMSLRRDLTYTDGNESFGVTQNPEIHGPLCVFWFDYMNALVDGNLAKLKAMSTDDYIEENLQMDRITPQKVYGFEAELQETWDLRETGDGSGNYKGYIVYYFKVSYRIKDNNGTFRRDFYDDEHESTVPLRIEVLQYGDDLRINSQIPIRTIIRQSEEKGVNIMLYIWIGLILMAIIAELTSTALVAVWFIPAGVASLILSIVKPDWIVVQIVTYVAVSALLLILTRPLVRIRLQKGNYQPTNADMAVGKIAIVTERIDNIAQTGEVKLDGKRWTARTADCSVIEPDTLVSVLEIRGVKLICEKAPKSAKIEK